MAQGATRSSTQDNSAGTLVATATNEGAAAALQAMVPVGNKTTEAETGRTGITSADAPTGGDMTVTGFAGSSGANLLDLENCMSVSMRATCSLAGKQLTGRLALYDGSNNCTEVLAVVVFVSDSTLRLGNASGDFICAQVLKDVGDARKARFFVDTVSGGTWAVYVRPI